MPRRRTQAVTWETVVDDLSVAGLPNIIRKKPKQNPFIYIEHRPTGKLKTLNPLSWQNMDDVNQAADICRWLQEGELTKGQSVASILKKIEQGEEFNSDEVIYSWDQVMDLVDEHLIKTMKASSAKNYRADIRNLRNAETPFIWKKVRTWIFEKDLSSRPFKNRLDALEQLRLAITSKFGDEPAWLRRIDLVALREQHNSSATKSKRYQPGQDLGGVRAIPTQKEAEKYLDDLDDQFELHRWCLAMQMCYGLRNHELWHSSPLVTNPDDKSFKQAILMIPGNWRTKSKFTHWTFPLFPTWVAKYKLIEDFDIMQEQLHKKAKPRIMSAIDMSQRWKPGNSKDLGVCVNNDYLGNWISKEMRVRMPKWLASVPNAKGQFTKSGEKETVKPYDLRHAWAVTLATSSEWSHIDENDAALAMGHNVDIHRKHYQRWISEDDTRNSFLKRITPPKWHEEAA